MTLAVRIEGGDKAGMPLVLIHGFGQGGFAFDPLIPFLAHDGPVLIPDLPGHAGSLSEPAGGAGRMAKAVTIELGLRGVTRFHLAGHSLGGATAALMALRNPDQVASLSLLAPGGMGPEINADALARHARAASETEIAETLHIMYGSGKGPDAAMVSRMVAERNEPGALDALETIRSAMIGPDCNQGTIDLSVLSGLLMPVGVLWGDQDRIVPASQTGALAAPVRVTVLNGIGHMLMAEAPATVAQFMLEQIARTL